MPGQLPEKTSFWIGGADGAPERVDRPPRAPALDEVVIEVEAVALGRPELRALARRAGFAPGEAAVGTVAFAGDAAADLVGARVLIGPVEACGECDVCRRGHPALCATRGRAGLDRDGALASHTIARGRWLTPLAGALAGVAPGPTAALLGREAALAYTMLARAGVGPGDTVLWLGATGASALGMAITAAKGAIGHVVGEPVSADELRARVATEPGAIPWKVMETSGGDEGRRRALALARFGATVVLASADAAGADDDGPLALGAALDADVTLLAVAAPHPDLVPETAALVGRGELALDGARVFPIAELAAALAHARTGALTVVSMR